MAKPALSTGLKNFDSMPNSAFIVSTDVSRLIGYSRQTLARKQREGTFPSEIKLSPRRRVFRVGDVRAYLELLSTTN